MLKRKKRVNKKEEKIRHMSIKLDIIGLYSGGYDKRYGVREMARKLNINHQTALNHLNLLVENNILGYERKGRNKEVSLNLDNINTKLLMDAAEALKSYAFLAKEHKIKIIVQDIKKAADTIVVFGSYAKGVYDKESDLDLLILGKADKHGINRIRGNSTLEINIKYSTFDEFERLLRKGNNLPVEILKNHLLFGDIANVTGIFWRYFNERR